MAGIKLSSKKRPGAWRNKEKKAHKYKDAKLDKKSLDTLQGAIALCGLLPVFTFVDWAHVVKVIGETGLEKINNCANGIVRKVSTRPTDYKRSEEPKTSRF